MKARKIAVLGSRAVGKSSLIVQYVEGHFTENYYPTIENSFQKPMRYRSQEYQLEIVDTAGQDEYSLMNSKHVIGIHGYVLAYSITSKSSLEMLHVIRDKILNYTGLEWVPIVLVGNKMDLDAQRQVSVEDAQKLAQQWNAVSIEASAKLNQNIQRIFELSIHEIEKGTGDGNEPQATTGNECLIL